MSLSAFTRLLFLIMYVSLPLVLSLSSDFSANFRLLHRYPCLYRWLRFSFPLPRPLGCDPTFLRRVPIFLLAPLPLLHHQCRHTTQPEMLLEIIRH